MKKKVISLFLSIVMICTLLPTAFAANETVTAQEAASAADHLNTLGLFKGTGTDENGNPTYDLEASSNRYAAVTMLVRLLGKEEEALSKTWDTPFTDVAAWAKPYVGYAYANGLTNGVNKEGTLFGGSQNVTTTQYLTFVLRALGYDSSKDFKWNAAWELSDKIGLTDGRYNSGSGDFLRGDMAFISFCAMDVKQKDSEHSLAEKLITEDVFTAEQYKNLAAEEAPKEEAPKEEVPKPEVLKETTVGSVPVTFAVNGTMMPGWDWAYCGSASSYIVTPYLHGSPL